MSKNFVEIKNDRLVFNFADLKQDNQFELNFHRTLRIPDDNKKYSLPPSIGSFPLEHVEDYKNNLPEVWSEHGGIFFPMYQAEAMWMSFSTPSGRPFAVKVASGKVNAVSGKSWDNKLQGSVKEEPYTPGPGDILRSERRINGGDKVKPKVEPDYMVSPTQPWLDGFNVGKGVIRQFVAVPLESGYTVEEQVTGKAEHGGIQIIVYPMKEEKWAKLKEERGQERSRGICASGAILECAPMMSKKSVMRASSAKPDMGLGAGGMMTQEIFDDEYGVDAWDESQGLRVFVHLANSEQYKAITGKNPPTEPPTPSLYARYNFPWFDYYSDAPAIEGSDILAKVDSVGSMQTKKGEKILPDEGHSPKQPTIKLGHKGIKSGNW